MNERKARLIGAIKRAHPRLTVQTKWSQFDEACSGISIHASHAATGNVLTASKGDYALEEMNDAEILTWVSERVAEFEGRQRTTRHAIATEREMGR